MGLFSGHIEVGFIDLFACMEAPAKKKVWNHFAAPNVQRALFLESEDSGWMIKRRIREFAKGLGLQPGKIPGFRYSRIGPIDLVKSEKQISQALERYRPDFVVLSTLQNLLNGASMKEQTDMAAINAMILRLASKQPIVVITHSPWDKTQKRSLGTVTTPANYATTMHLEKKKETLVRVTLDSKMGMGTTSPDFSLELVLDVKTGKEVRRGVYLANTAKASAIRAELKANPKAKTKDLAAKYGVDERHIRQIKAQMRGKKRPKNTPETEAHPEQCGF
jgi:hypothetical protein